MGKGGDRVYPILRGEIKQTEYTSPTNGRSFSSGGGVPFRQQGGRGGSGFYIPTRLVLKRWATLEGLSKFNRFEAEVFNHPCWNSLSRTEVLQEIFGG